MNGSKGPFVRRAFILVLLNVMIFGCQTGPKDSGGLGGGGGGSLLPFQVIREGYNYALVAENAVIINPGVSDPVAIAPDSITFGPGSPGAAATVGQVLCGAYAGGGYIRIITGLTANPDGSVTFATADGFLTDCFFKADIGVNIKNVAAAPAGRLLPDSDFQPQLVIRDVIDYDFSYQDHLDTPFGPYINRSSDLEISAGTGLDILIGIEIRDSQLSYFKYTVYGHIKDEAEIDVAVPVAAYYPAPWAVDLADVPLGGVNFFGPLYLNLDLETIPTMQASAQTAVNAHAGYVASFAFEQGLIYDRGTVTYVNEHYEDFRMGPSFAQITGDIAINGGLWFNFKPTINGMAAPALGLQPYFDTAGQFTAAPISCPVTIDLGLDANLHFDLDAFSDWIAVPPAFTPDHDLINPDEVYPLFENNFCIGGDIKGHVSDAVTLAAVAGVTVNIYDYYNNLVATTATNASGDYSFTDIGAGYGSMTFSKTGYITAVGYVTVEGGQTIIYETVLLVDQAHAGSSAISGIIRNAVTGQPVSGVNVMVRAGINNRFGTALTTVTSAANGSYSLTRDGGNYTVELFKNGYLSSFYTLAFIGGVNQTKDMTIIPFLDPDQGRIVLSWGISPSDLDTHFVKHNAAGAVQYHIYYMNRGTTASEAWLDVDDVTSYGPETVTFRPLDPAARYTYLIHDYTNRIATSGAFYMANSGASIMVVFDGTFYIFYVPHEEGTVWKVFEIVGGVLQPCTSGCMSYQSSPGMVGESTSISPDILELFQNLPEKNY